MPYREKFDRSEIFALALAFATFELRVLITLALGLVSYVSSKRDYTNDESSALSLLPGDIKYQSPSGNFRFYFPITTSIVISIILSLVLYFLR